MIGAIPMMWMRAVWGSRERCLGAWPLPLSITSSHTSSWALIGSGRRAVLAAKYRSTWETRSSMSKPAAARTSRVELMLPS